MVVSEGPEPQEIKADSAKTGDEIPDPDGPSEIAPIPIREISANTRRDHTEEASDPFADLISADLTDSLLHPIWLHFASATVALVATIVLWAEVGPKHALLWGVLAVAAYGGRLVIVLLYRDASRRRTLPRQELTRRWIRRYYPSAILLGVFWGGAPAVIAQSPASASDGSAALMLFLSAWMMAGSVMTHSARIDAVDVFIWPAGILLAVAGLTWPQWPYRMIAALAIPFVVMLRLLGLRLHAASVDALRGQYEKAALADQLFRANAEVREASRAKSEFLANMSHELRTPLNAIIGFSEIMARQILGPIGLDRYRDYASDIQNSGTHLLGVINDILDLSRVEAGRMTLLEDKVDLADVIGSCVHLLSHRAATAGVALDTDFSDATPPIHADEGRIRQIGFNLIANAIKFTPQGGQARIVVAANAQGEVTLTVADTGIGMRPEDIPIALAPFQQVQTAGLRNHGGTGLGLPLTKTLVELHGGRLDIFSALGVGTTVTVIFPRSRILPTK